ncbi:MAG: PAS domain S-box protein [Pseudomonas sp.]|uniref:PAS domain S-box protein n=1 Tax=Pseudomonas sp. TaxID=306 RepID=UPI003981D030
MHTDVKPSTMRWIAALGSLGLTILFAWLGGGALSERESLWQLQISKQHELQRQALSSANLNLANQAHLLARTLAADERLLDLVHQAYALDKNSATAAQTLQNIRRQLLNHLQPRWRTLQSSHPFNLTLHLAGNAKVLLRVHQPEWFGDTPDAQRGMLFDVLQNVSGQAGLGVVDDGLVVRAITPLQAEGNADQANVGALEISLDMANNLRLLDQELGAGVALLLGRSPRLGSSNTSAHPTWHLEGFSRPQVQRWQAQHLLPPPEAGDNLSLLQDQAQTYLLNQFVLPNYQTAVEVTEPAIVALTWYDISDLYIHYQHDRHWLLVQWLLAWLAAEALLLVLLKVTRHNSQILMRQHHAQLQAQQHMQRQQAALRMLNEITALPKLSAQQQLRQALTLGEKFYGMPIGIISQIEADTYRVIAQVSPPGSLQDGQCFALGDTYCSIVLRSDDVLAIAAMGESQHAAHPCYPLFALESYIGTRIWVAGQCFGTLCFASSEARSKPFDDADEAFLRLFARWIGATLEKLQHEEQSRAARRDLQAVLDSATGVTIITCSPQGLITLFNSGAERLLGYRSAEVIGQSSPALFHLSEEIQARGQQLSRQEGHEVKGFEVFTCIPAKGGSETRQWTYRCKSGEHRIVNLTVSPMRNAEGVINGYLGIASDISDLHQTTRALQKSESRFRGLVANLPGAVYRCHNDADWSMSYLSEEIQVLSGYPASDFINSRVRSFSSVVHPDDLPITYRAVAAIEQQKSFELTYRLLHADGHSVWVREKGRGEYNSQGQLQWISGFIWDISDRKAIEDQLRLSQQRFSSAFSTAPQGMALVSLQGQWLEVNEVLCEMLGYSREQLLNSNFQQLTHPDDLDTDLLHIEELLAGEVSNYQMEKRYLDSQGRIIWVLLSVSLVRDNDDNPVHFVVQIQDFNERIAAEMAIREREDYLRALLDNVFDAIITFDQQGYIETFNHAAERIFGYSHLEISGHRFTLLLPEPQRSTRARYLSHFLKTAIHKMLGKEIELAAMRNNGEVFTISLAISQISHQGERRFIAVIRDIEERKRIERMKNEFVSTVSHELRTPLTAIAGALGLINGGVLGSVPANMQQMLQIAQNNSQRLNLLINDLLDMEKLVAGKMLFELEDQPLQPLLEQAIKENQPYATRLQVTLQLQGPATQAVVRVDRLRLAQVMANLLSNAAKFSPHGQAVEVRIEQQGSRVRVSVRDHGAGVPENFQARIFSKFSQADATDTRQKGGTGLGLAISKEIIERMGGKIGFDSQPGHGATFWFELTTLTKDVASETDRVPEDNRHA